MPQEVKKGIRAFSVEVQVVVTWGEEEKKTKSGGRGE